MTIPPRHTLAIAALAIVGACHQSFSVGGSNSGTWGTTIHGSGDLVEENRPIGAVTSVVHSSEGALRVDSSAETPFAEYHTLVTLGTLAADGSRRVEESAPPAGQPESATLLVRAEDNLLPYLITEVHGGVLELRTSPGVDLQPTLPIEYFLTVDSLESATLHGVGSIRISDFDVPRLEVTSDGVGSVEVAGLQADELEAELAGLGEVRASGAVDSQTVRMSGFGHYRAEDLQSSEADVLVAGLGSATVRVSDLLVATVTSSGSVYYIGSPTVDATITGSGTVEQIDP